MAIPYRAPGALALAGALVSALAPTASAQETPRTEAERRLEERVRSLEDRLAEMEKEKREAPAGGPAADDDLEALRAAAESEARGGEASPSGEPGFIERAQSALNALNPRLTIFGDVLAPIELTGAGEEEADDRISLREAEIDLRAAIDPYASGVLIVAVEEEDPGAYEVDIEEGYLTLDTLPWRLHLKLGRFLPDIGNVNRTHTHDLPWSIRPLANQDFIGGEEGWIENGIALSWLSPEIGPLTLTLTAWVLNGENPAVLADSASDDPAYMGRVEAFIDLDGAGALTLGTNLLWGLNDEEGRFESALLTSDVLYQIRPSSLVSFALISETYYLEKETAGGTEHAFGAFVAGQVQPGLGSLWAPLTHTYLGVRYDVSSYDEQTEDADQWAIATYVSFYTTEFLRFRIGWEHRERETTALGRPDRDTLLFQATFVFGSHPAEPFWFNK